MSTYSGRRQFYANCKYHKDVKELFNKEINKIYELYTKEETINAVLCNEPVKIKLTKEQSIKALKDINF